MLNIYANLDGMVSNQQKKQKNQARLREAKQQIEIFIAYWKFNQSYKNILIDEFEKNQIKQRPKQWLQEKLLSKIRQELMRSITNFMRYLQQNEAIEIQVQKNQLDFQCSIDLKDTIGYTKLGIMQINNLSQTMYTHFDPKKFNQDNIPHKIEEMFKKLYDCLKFYMYNSFDGENVPIDELDFIIFNQKYLKQKYGKLQRNFNFIQDGIVIGGLFTCCYRFFRVLFEFFLSYQQLFLIPDLLKRSEQFCQKKEKFISQVQRYIRLKIDEIRDYQWKEAIRLEKQLNNEMDGFQYQNLYQHFIQNASTSTKKLYFSEESISLYRWQKLKSDVQNLQKIETSFDQNFSSQPTECSFLVKGLIVLEQDEELQIKKLFTNAGFKNRFKIDSDKFDHYKFIYATNKQDKVQIEKSGHFLVITKTQAQLQNVIGFIKNTYKKRQIELLQKSYVLKGHLGLTNLVLKQIVPTPCFNERIDIDRKERQKYVKNRRSRLSNTSVNENQQEEIHSLIYKFQKPVWDQFNLKKQEMKMHILKDGTVVITHVKDRDYAKAQFFKIQKNIKNYLNRKIIEQNQEKKRRQKLDEFMDITVLCYPKQTKLKQETQPQKDKQYFKNILTCRNTKTIQQKIIAQNKIISPLKTLKVLTWNILGYRKDDQIKNRKQQLESITDQNQRKQLLKQIQQEEKKRFMCMVSVIKQHDPDIVCLQEGYCLYRFNGQLFKQLLTTGLNGVFYHYAEYNKNKNDFPPVNEEDGKQGRNERTMILCKFPVKFSNLRSQYKNYFYDPKKQKSKPYSFKLSVVADFQIVLQKQKQLSVLISSIHLKSGNTLQDDNIREFQFNYLDRLAGKYDISIFAGDFNSYDQPYTQPSKLSAISQLIKNKGYVDFEKYLVSKLPTHRRLGYKPSILDKILIKFQDQKLKQRLKVKQIKFPGSFTNPRYEEQSWNIIYSDGTPRALSDHIGLFAQFGFSK